jgi:cathepsin A (carboxypeptidase C)
LINDDGATLRMNPYSWNTAANVLYLEAPAGVGFSFDSAQPSSPYAEDWEVAADNYKAILLFLQRFPEFASNDFFVSGESYGGIYVPTLTYIIVSGNKAGQNTPINLQGFAIGNGLASYELNDNALPLYAYYHMLFDTALWVQLNAACPDGNFHSPATQECKTAVAAAMGSVYNSGINFYGIYSSCHVNPSNGVADAMSHAFTQNGALHASLAPLGEDVPCINSTAGTNYLNRPDVRAAIHVENSPNSWAICEPLNYNRTVQDVRSIWADLINTEGLRGMLYFGDTDFACSALHGEMAVDSLGWDQTTPRREWHVQDQVAGFVQTYKDGDFSFVTVRGAGHMVPQWRPPQALHMIQAFLAGQPL